MKTYKKNYVGKGTQVENLQIVKVTLNISEMLKFKHEYEGEEYVTFEVARMQNPDKFGKTHTVYCSTCEDVDEEKVITKSRKTKKPVNA